MRKIYFLCVLLLFSSACAISVKVPTNRLESPEALGRTGNIKLEALLKDNSETILSKDYTVYGPDTRTPDITRARDVVIGVGVGVIERLDVSARTGSSVQLKYQFLGEPARKAKQGNFSLAVTAAGGYSLQRGSGQVFWSTEKAEYRLASFFYDTSLIAGIRALDVLLFYGGPSYSKYIYRGDRKIGSSATGNFNGTIYQPGVHVGAQIGNNAVQGKLELGYAYTYAGESKKDQALVGVSLSFNIPEGESNNTPKEPVQN